MGSTSSATALPEADLPKTYDAAGIETCGHAAARLQLLAPAGCLPCV